MLGAFLNQQFEPVWITCDLYCTMHRIVLRFVTLCCTTLCNNALHHITRAPERRERVFLAATFCKLAEKASEISVYQQK